MRISITVILLLIIKTFSFGQYGYIHWENTTRNGTLIARDDNSVTSLISENSKVNIDNLKRWYFLNDYIIGETSTNYFIFNEKKNESLIFTNKDNFQNAIQTNSLEPVIWKKWHDDEFEINWTNIIAPLVYAGIFTLPLFLLLIYSTTLTLKYRNQKTKIGHKTLTLISWTLITILILNKWYYWSI